MWKKLPDIQEIIAEKEICKILSFNYTNTIERVYIDKSNMDIDFIHGKANKDLEIEKIIWFGNWWISSGWKTKYKCWICGI